MGNRAIELCNSLGDRWTIWMAAALLDSLSLVALIALAWFAIRRRAAPQVGYCLFLLVPLRLLSPIEVDVPHGVARWTPSQLVASWLAHRAVPDPLAPPAETPAIALDHSLGRAATMRSPFASDRLPLARKTAAAKSPAPLTTGPVIKSPLQWSAIGMLAWFGVVSLLSARLAWMQWEFRRRLRRAQRIDARQLPIDFRALCIQAGLRRTVRLVESDRIAAPAAWGIVRSTIILPSGIGRSLDEKQLRWVLLHELAHFKRLDLPAILLQRLAAILNFFNPAIWIANRVANRLREYACDDFATLAGDGTGVESSEAFVLMLRNEYRAHRRLEGALGIFGLDSRAECFARIRRMLDADRPLRMKTGRLSLAAIVVLAAVALPHLRAATGQGEVALQPAATNPPASEPKKTGIGADKSSDAAKPGAKTEPSPNANSVDRSEEQTFTLTVVGPHHKPLPGITIHCLSRLALTVDRPERGRILRQSQSVHGKGFGSLIKLDERGQFRCVIPKNLDYLEFLIVTPGYGPYLARWTSDEHPEPIPAALTAELDAAWSIGGIIVDQQGKPVQGATVINMIETKKRPGLHLQLAFDGRVKTDGNGRWHYDSVPVSIDKVTTLISDPRFEPLEEILDRAGFEIKPGAAPVATISLSAGVTVTGTITDEAGHPIAGAHVRTQPGNDLREATTGKDGTYQLTGCRATGLARIVASAKGHATDMRQLAINPFMPSVDFQMKPGGTIRIRVVDAQGKPVPKARIFFQSWRGGSAYFDFDDVSQYADAHGVWQWNEAPPDEIQADICGGEHDMDLSRRPILARKEEYVFKLLRPLMISGTVVDAQTRKPIEKSRVVPGTDSQNAGMYWDNRNSFAAEQGKFQLRFHREARVYRVRIEADGYLPAESREIKSDEGIVTLGLELKKTAQH